MKQSSTRIPIETKGKGLYDFTRRLSSWIKSQEVKTALLTVFVQHTSCSLTIQENADPDVTKDLNDFFGRLVPDDSRLYRHTVEGPDDMPAHIRAVLTQTSLSIPIHEGEMALGTWQGLYLFEHRSTPHRRNVVLHLLG